MAVSKVILNGTTIVDLTGDTAEPSEVLNNETFHDRSGTPQTGSMITHDVYNGLDSDSITDALSAKQGKVLLSKLGGFNCVELGSINNSEMLLTFSGNVRLILVGTGAANSRQFMCFGYGQASYNCYVREISKGSGITITAGAGTISISSTDTGSTVIHALILGGNADKVTVSYPNAA